MRKAFTMIELVFVIVILGILASVAIPRLAATRDDAEVSVGVQRLSNMVVSIGTYYTAHGKFDSDVSKMTSVILTDSSKNIYNGNFLITPAYFPNVARSKNCLKIVVDDTNGTLTISDESDSSSYCKVLTSEAKGMIKQYTFGGSRVY